MDLESTTTSHESSYLDLLDQNNNGSEVNDSESPPGCGLCGRTLSLEGEFNVVHQNVSICDDCKFLLIEDLGTSARNSSGRRQSRRSRSIYGSSEATGNLFSRHFSQIINLARQVEPAHEEVLEDALSNWRLHQPSSSHTMSNRRRLLSDAESDFSNSDIYYGENESNISYGTYYHGDSDTVSLSIYGGDSDSSVDSHPLFNTDIIQSAERSDLDSDFDINPMHAGNAHWDVTAHEEMEDFLDSGAHVNTNRGSGSLIRHRTLGSLESVGANRWRISDINLQASRFHVGMEEELSGAPYISDPDNYLDARAFDEFLEHIAESDHFRQGPPPASTSFVMNLPLIAICEEDQKPDGLACAICKDLLTTGTEVNQLPCLHLYHPNCILPWLKARNSCPLCRYELPTDDIDYELGKRNAIIEIERRDDQDDSSSIMTDSSEMNEVIELRKASEDRSPSEEISQSGRGRGRRFLLAAAPIVSLMGVVFMLWLGKPFAGKGRGQVGQSNLICRPSGSCPRSERGKRWWWF